MFQRTEIEGASGLIYAESTYIYKYVTSISLELRRASNDKGQCKRLQ